MKKMCTAAIAIAMAAACAVPAKAAGRSTVAIKADEVYSAGSFVVISQNISANDISGVHLSFDYDHSSLKLTGITTANGHEYYYESADSLDWSTLLSSNGTALSGDKAISSFRFEVLKDIEKSSEFMTITVKEAYDHNTNNVDYFTGGKITVSNDLGNGIFGDIDKDGFITSTDALTALRSSVGLYTLSPAEQIAADVNSDRSIDSSDALSILRYSVDLSSGSELIGTKSSGSLSSYTINL